jgi:hypothetical protein
VTLRAVATVAHPAHATERHASTRKSFASKAACTRGTTASVAALRWGEDDLGRRPRRLFERLTRW